MNEPTHLDLFSGIGGFALAAKWAGFRTIGFCEIDPYCQKVLAKNFGAILRDPNGNSKSAMSVDAEVAELRSNIFALNGGDFAGVSLITGGFPCQPFSCAGKRRGKDDDRAIWPEMFRVISEARPAWVLGENVAGIINMELDNMLSDLEGIGYACRPFVIPACGVDARHRRNRVWIVGHGTNSDQGGLTRGHEQDGGRGESGWPQCPCWWEPEPDVGRVAHGIPKMLDITGIVDYISTHGSEKEVEMAQAIAKNSEGRKVRILRLYLKVAAASYGLEEAGFSGDSLSGLPHESRHPNQKVGKWEQEETEVRRVQEMVSSEGLASACDLRIKGMPINPWQVQCWLEVGKRVDRLRGLGNAIVPQVAYQILKAIRGQIA